MELTARLVLFAIFVIGVIIVIISLFLPLLIAFNYLALGVGIVIFSILGMAVYKFFFK